MSPYCSALWFVILSDHLTKDLFWVWNNSAALVLRGLTPRQNSPCQRSTWLASGGEMAASRANDYEIIMLHEGEGIIRADVEINLNGLHWIQKWLNIYRFFNLCIHLLQVYLCADGCNFEVRILKTSLHRSRQLLKKKIAIIIRDYNIWQHFNKLFNTNSHSGFVKKNIEHFIEHESWMPERYALRFDSIKNEHKAICS